MFKSPSDIDMRIVYTYNLFLFDWIHHRDRDRPIPTPNPESQTINICAGLLQGIAYGDTVLQVQYHSHKVHFLRLAAPERSASMKAISSPS